MNAFVWFAQKSNTIYCASLNAEKNYWASIKLRCTILWTCTIPLFLLFSACNVMYSAAVAIRDNNFVQHINLHAFILLLLLYCCWKRLHVYVCLVDLYLPLIELSNKFIIMCAQCAVYHSYYARCALGLDSHGAPRPNGFEQWYFQQQKYYVRISTCTFMHDFYKVVFATSFQQTDDWKSKTRKSHQIMIIIESSSVDTLMGNTSQLTWATLVRLCVCPTVARQYKFNVAMTCVLR